MSSFLAPIKLDSNGSQDNGTVTVNGSPVAVPTSSFNGSSKDIQNGTQNIGMSKERPNSLFSTFREPNQRKNSFQMDLNAQSNQMNITNGPPKTGLSLDLNGSTNDLFYKPQIRKKPILSFGCPILSVVAEDVDVTIPLKKQG